MSIWKYYYNVRTLNKNWLYESGWNAKVRNLTDRINIHLINKLSFEDANVYINYGGHINYEKIQIL